MSGFSYEDLRGYADANDAYARLRQYMDRTEVTPYEQEINDARDHAMIMRGEAGTVNSIFGKLPTRHSFVGSSAQLDTLFDENSPDELVRMGQGSGNVNPYDPNEPVMPWGTAKRRGTSSGRHIFQSVTGLNDYEMYEMGQNAARAWTRTGYEVLDPLMGVLAMLEFRGAQFAEQATRDAESLEEATAPSPVRLEDTFYSRYRSLFQERLQRRLAEDGDLRDADAKSLLAEGINLFVDSAAGVTTFAGHVAPFLLGLPAGVATMSASAYDYEYNAALEGGKDAEAAHTEAAVRSFLLATFLTAFPEIVKKPMAGGYEYMRSMSWFRNSFDAASKQLVPLFQRGSVTTEELVSFMEKKWFEKTFREIAKRGTQTPVRVQRTSATAEAEIVDYITRTQAQRGVAVAAGQVGARSFAAGATERILGDLIIAGIDTIAGREVDQLIDAEAALHQGGVFAGMSLFLFGAGLPFQYRAGRRDMMAREQKISNSAGMQGTAIEEAGVAATQDSRIAVTPEGVAAPAGTNPDLIQRRMFQQATRSTAFNLQEADKLGLLRSRNRTVAENLHALQAADEPTLNSAIQNLDDLLGTGPRALAYKPEELKHLALLRDYMIEVRNKRFPGHGVRKVEPTINSILYPNSKMSPEELTAAIKRAEAVQNLMRQNRPQMGAYPVLPSAEQIKENPQAALASLLEHQRRFGGVYLSDQFFFDFEGQKPKPDSKPAKADDDPTDLPDPVDGEAGSVVPRNPDTDFADPLTGAQGSLFPLGGTEPPAKPSNSGFDDKAKADPAYLETADAVTDTTSDLADGSYTDAHSQDPRFTLDNVLRESRMTAESTRENFVTLGNSDILPGEQGRKQTDRERNIMQGTMSLFAFVEAFADVILSKPDVMRTAGAEDIAAIFETFRKRTNAGESIRAPYFTPQAMIQRDRTGAYGNRNFQDNYINYFQPGQLFLPSRQSPYRGRVTHSRTLQGLIEPLTALQRSNRADAMKAVFGDRPMVESRTPEAGGSKVRQVPSGSKMAKDVFQALQRLTGNTSKDATTRLRRRLKSELGIEVVEMRDVNASVEFQIIPSRVGGRDFDGMRTPADQGGLLPKETGLAQLVELLDSSTKAADITAMPQSAGGVTLPFGQTFAGRTIANNTGGMTLEQHMGLEAARLQQKRKAQKKDDGTTDRRKAYDPNYTSWDIVVTKEQLQAGDVFSVMEGAMDVEVVKLTQEQAAELGFPDIQVNDDGLALLVTHNTMPVEPQLTTMSDAFMVDGNRSPMLRMSKNDIADMLRALRFTKEFIEAQGRKPITAESRRPGGDADYRLEIKTLGMNIWHNRAVTNLRNLPWWTPRKETAETKRQKYEVPNRGELNKLDNLVEFLDEMIEVLSVRINDTEVGPGPLFEIDRPEIQQGIDAGRNYRYNYRRSEEDWETLAGVRLRPFSRNPALGRDVQRTIDRATGVKQAGEQKKQQQGLRRQLQELERVTMAAFREGRIQARNDLKADFDELKQQKKNAEEAAKKMSKAKAKEFLELQEFKRLGQLAILYGARITPDGRIVLNKKTKRDEEILVVDDELNFEGLFEGREAAEAELEQIRSGPGGSTPGTRTERAQLLVDSGLFQANNMEQARKALYEALRQNEIRQTNLLIEQTLGLHTELRGRMTPEVSALFDEVFGPKETESGIQPGLHFGPINVDKLNELKEFIDELEVSGAYFPESVRIQFGRELELLDRQSIEDFALSGKKPTKNEPQPTYQDVIDADPVGYLTEIRDEMETLKKIANEQIALRERQRDQRIQAFALEIRANVMAGLEQGFYAEASKLSAAEIEEGLGTLGRMAKDPGILPDFFYLSMPELVERLAGSRNSPLYNAIYLETEKARERTAIMMIGLSESTQALQKGLGLTLDVISQLEDKDIGYTLTGPTFADVDGVMVEGPRESIKLSGEQAIKLGLLLTDDDTFRQLLLRGDKAGGNTENTSIAFDRDTLVELKKIYEDIDAKYGLKKQINPEDVPGRPELVGPGGIERFIREAHVILNTGELRKMFLEFQDRVAVENAPMGVLPPGGEKASHVPRRRRTQGKKVGPEDEAVDIKQVADEVMGGSDVAETIGGLAQRKDITGSRARGEMEFPISIDGFFRDFPRTVQQQAALYGLGGWMAEYSRVLNDPSVSHAIKSTTASILWERVNEAVRNMFVSESAVPLYATRGAEGAMNTMINQFIGVAQRVNLNSIAAPQVVAYQAMSLDAALALYDPRDLPLGGRLSATENVPMSFVYTTLFNTGQSFIEGMRSGISSYFLGLPFDSPLFDGPSGNAGRRMLNHNALARQVVDRSALVLFADMELGNQNIGRLVAGQADTRLGRVLDNFANLSGIAMNDFRTRSKINHASEHEVFRQFTEWWDSRAAGAEREFYDVNGRPINDLFRQTEQNLLDRGVPIDKHGPMVLVRNRINPDITETASGTMTVATGPTRRGMGRGYDFVEDFGKLPLYQAVNAKTNYANKTQPMGDIVHANFVRTLARKNPFIALGNLFRTAPDRVMATSVRNAGMRRREGRLEDYEQSILGFYQEQAQLAINEARAAAEEAGMSDETMLEEMFGQKAVDARAEEMRDEARRGRVDYDESATGVGYGGDPNGNPTRKRELMKFVSLAMGIGMIAQFKKMIYGDEDALDLDNVLAESLSRGTGTADVFGFNTLRFMMQMTGLMDQYSGRTVGEAAQARIGSLVQTISGDDADAGTRVAAAAELALLISLARGNLRALPFSDVVGAVRESLEDDRKGPERMEPPRVDTLPGL